MGTAGVCKTKVTNLCYPAVGGLCPGGTYPCSSGSSDHTFLAEVDAVLRSARLPEIEIPEQWLRREPGGTWGESTELGRN